MKPEVRIGENRQKEEATEESLRAKAEEIKTSISTRVPAVASLWYLVCDMGLKGSYGGPKRTARRGKNYLKLKKDSIRKKKKQ